MTERIPFWGYIRESKKQYALIIFTILLSSFFSFVVVSLLPHALNHLRKDIAFLPWRELIGEHPSRWLAPLLRNTFITDGIPIELQKKYLPIGLIFSALIVFLCKFSQEYLLEDIGEKIALKIRTNLTKKFLVLDLNSSLSIEPGKLATMFGEDIKDIRQTFTRSMGSFISDLSMSLVFLTWLLLLDTQLFIMILLVMTPALILIRLLGKKLKHLGRKGIEVQSALFSLLLERLCGAETISTFHAVAFELEKFKKVNDELYKVNKRSSRAKALSSPVVEWFGTAAGSLVVIIALRRISDGELSGTTFAAFLVTVGYLSGHTQALSSQWTAAKRGLSALSQIRDFLKSDNSLLSKKPDHLLSTDSITSFSVRGLSKIIPGNKELFSDINFDLIKGDILAIYGPSGVGKSSLLKILLGLDKQTSGQILINGKTVNFLEQDVKPGFFGYVSQSAFLFHSSIAYNICYPENLNPFDNGIPKITEALDKAQLKKEVTLAVTNLSGGEKQRLAMARCFYHKPALWLIDEGTSALDAETERELLKNIKIYAKECIVIAVTHRKSISEIATKSLYIGKPQTE